MIGPSVLLLGTFMVGVATCRMALRLVTRLQILDHPNLRSSHEVPTPRGGGIGILAAVLLGAVVGALLLAPVPAPSLRTWAGLLAATLLLAAVGFADDRRDLRPLTKALPQLLAGAIAVLAVGPVTVVALPGLNVSLGVLALPLTAFWLLGFSNGYNFMDGIDGIAALQAGVAALALFVAAEVAGAGGGAWLLLPLAGASLSFLTVNWPPARVFMGDVASLPVGFLLAASALPALGAGIPFVTVFLVLGPFLFDTIYTLLARASRRENVLAAHRCHLYQRLVIAGLSHGSVTALYGGWTLLSSALGILYLTGGSAVRGAVLLAALLAGVGLVIGVLSLERGRSEDEPGE